MSDPKTIHERMAAILKELPPIGKDQKNMQQNFMFRGHDDVLNALNPLLAKHGVFALPHVLARETTQRSTKGGSVMFEVSLLVEYTFHGAAGDSVRGSAWGEGTDMGDKATSKAMTMAFKSILNQAFAISNKELADPDAHTADESLPAKNVAPAGNAGQNPADEKTAATFEAETRLLALNLQYKQLVPDFDTAVVPKKIEEKRSHAKFAEWLDAQVAAFGNNIASKKGEIAAAEKFPIPDGAKAA